MFMNIDQIVLKVVLSIILSGLIGWEREIRNKDAGLRTHILVGLGSTFIVLTSLHLSDIYKSPSMDPTRMIAAIVQGIGFLCGGAILQMGTTTVKGLTTAATLWIVSGIGIAVGAGDYITAIVGTMAVMLVLFIVRQIEFSIHQNEPKSDKP